MEQQNMSEQAQPQYIDPDKCEFFRVDMMDMMGTTIVVGEEQLFEFIGTVREAGEDLMVQALNRVFQMGYEAGQEKAINEVLARVEAQPTLVELLDGHTPDTHPAE